MGKIYWYGRIGPLGMIRMRRLKIVRLFWRYPNAYHDDLCECWLAILWFAVRIPSKHFTPTQTVAGKPK